jgi:methionyl-tRNA synthetase
MGNTIDPIELVEKYGVEPIKYFLLRYVPSYGDGDFSVDLFKTRYQSDLSNDLGNLLQRTLTMAEKYDIKPTDLLGEMIPGVAEMLDIYRFDLALEKIWVVVRSLNVLIDDKKPWDLAKSDPEELEVVMRKILKDLCDISISIEPFMPKTSQQMKEQLVTFKPISLFPRLIEGDK